MNSASRTTTPKPTEVAAVGPRVPAVDFANSLFVFKINDDHMAPEYRAGDHVIVDQTIDPEPGDYVVTKNDDALFELALFGAGSSACCPGENDAPRVIGVVVERRRKYRY